MAAEGGEDLIQPRPDASFAGRRAARLAVGTMRLAGAAPASVRALLEAGREAGLTIVDTAPIYGVGGPGFGDVEERLGQAYSETPDLRDGAILVTKAGIEPGKPYDSSHDALLASCDASLRRLRTDRIDLFLVHRPDDLTSHTEVADALGALLEAGKVAAVGVSNYRPSQVRALAAHLGRPPAVNQVEASPLEVGALRDGTLDLCQEAGIVPMAWSPLGGGRLLGRAEEMDRRGRAVADALDALGQPVGLGRDGAALAWVLAHPSGMVPVLGTTSPARVASARAALNATVGRRAWYDVFEAALGGPMP